MELHPPQSEHVFFLVNNKLYSLSLDRMNNFPIQDSYLHLIYSKHLSKQFDIKTRNGAIIINNDEIKHFDKIIEVYIDPKITLVKLLKLNDLLEVRLVAEHKKLDFLRENNVYKFLEAKSYKEFWRELKYFGIHVLFQSKLKRYYKQNGIDTRLMIDNLIVRLTEYLPDSKKFLDDMKSIGGYMSGSFLTRSVLEEDWECNDLDIFVNFSMLKGMLKVHNYGGSKPLNDQFQTPDDLDKAMDRMKRTVWSDKTDDEKTQLMSENRIEYRLELGRTLAIHFGFRLVSILALTESSYEEIRTRSFMNRVSEDPIMDSNERRHLLFVIKLEYRSTKIDIVVIDCTVPYFIEAFDFDFNKIFFDGYSIHAFDWASVMNKQCVNKSFNRHHDSSDYLGRYVKNIDRIEKYHNRGFIIIPNVIMNPTVIALPIQFN